MKKILTFISVIILASSAVSALALDIDDEFITSLSRALDEKGYEIVKKSGEESEEEKKSWWQTEAESAGFLYDVYFRTVMLRHDTFTVGGGVNLGVETDSFQFAVYGLGDYFMSPLGGNGGAASLEYMVETGVMFSWKFVQAWVSRTYIAIDAGYFMQYAKIPQDTSTIFLANNGIMIRPKVYTLIQIGKYYNMSIGFFYQIPLYPVYTDYSGFGAFLSIL